MSSYPPDNENSPSTPIFEETVEDAGEPWTEPVPDGAPAASWPPPPTVDTAAAPVNESSTVDTARDEAQNVASDAKDAAQNVAGVAKDEAKGVAAEAKTQAKDLIAQTTSELKDQAATQQKRVASGLHSVGDEFESMADGSVGGVASELVRTLGDRAESVASWLDGRDPGSLLDEVKSFAARKPGTFIAIAAGVGIVAGRLTKSLAAAASDEAKPSTAHE
jgi:ElaB/YqjD/DUF883 family membrane-anchored ribosome-binding protein